MIVIILSHIPVFVIVVMILSISFEESLNGGIIDFADFLFENNLIPRFHPS